MFKNRFQKILIIFLLSISSYACAGNQENSCISDNVIHQADCINKSNEKLKSKLKAENNNEKNDYNQWLKLIKNKCEGSVSYTSGEGIGLIKEQCYNDEYKNRLKFLDNKLIEKEKNNDGFLITNLPYSSQIHLKCLRVEDKKSCNIINLIPTSKLIKVYNFINPQYGSSIVLPQTPDGKLIIISPFSDEDGTVLNINIVDKFGVVKEMNLSENSKFNIDKNYNLIYKEKGKAQKMKL